MNALEGLRGARVFVTGGHGFLGQVVCRRFAEAGADVLAPTHAELELRDGTAVHAWTAAHKPQVFVHLAARVGGIGANQKHPGTYWRDNTLMGVHVMDAAREIEARRIVIVGTVCAYPKFTPVPFEESELWNGYPEETNAPYGVAKRSLAVGMEAYLAEFGLRGAYLLPANLYGPNDNFDLEMSHVIPAMIRRFEEARVAKATEVTLWGTGTPSREFLYVEDCAEAVVLASATCDDPAPMNLGTGQETTIADLATMIAAAVGYEGAVAYDPTRPDGQPRRALDTSAATKRLQWTARTALPEGLAATVAWYRDAVAGAASA